MSEEKMKGHKIFFIVDENERIVFVGKSAARDLQPILRRFVYRETPEAEEAFGDLPHPSLVLVEQSAISCTATVAEVYVEAWRDFFKGLGYKVYCKPSREYIQRFPSGFSRERVWQQVRCNSEQSALYGSEVKRHMCRKQEKEVKGPAQKHTTNASLYSLLIRTSKSVASKFRLFCKSLGVTQNEGLAILLEQDGEEKISLSCRDLMMRLKCAERKIAELEGKISELKSGKEADRRKKRIERFKGTNRIHQRLVREYLRYAPKPKPMSTEKLFRFKFKIFRTRFSAMWDEYFYPNEIGTEVIYLTKFVYGQTDGIAFVFGYTEKGEQIKLRYYLHRNNYIGVPIWSGEHVRENAPWLVGYIKAADGATDLIGAFPLSQAWLENNMGSFADKVADAMERAKKR